jgi:hypothetical protein
MVGKKQFNGLAGATAAIALVAMVLASPVHGAVITTTGSDGFGTSSFNSAGVWSDSLAPQAGNDYVIVTGHRVRTPADGASYTFAGDSLTVADGGTNEASGLSYKGTGGTGTITISNLILDGGSVNHINGSGDVFNLDGNINVISDSVIYAKQGPINLLAAVSGSATITNPGSDDTNRTLTFMSASNTFTGDIVNNGRMNVADDAVMNFVIGAAGVNNTISGTGAETVFEGDFVLDLTGASANPGDTWTLVSTANVSYTATFTVVGFTETLPGIWDGTDYWYETATGVLSYGEPPTIAGIILGVGGDTIGTSSFDNDGSNNWSDGLDPSAGKDYVVTVQFLRSPTDAVDYVFQGDTLRFRPGGAMISKHTAGRMLTANWIMDGGFIRSGSGGGLVETLAGTMDITSNGGEIRGDQTPYVITADISGDANGTLGLTGGSGVTVAGTNGFLGDVNASGSNLVWQADSIWPFEIGTTGVNNAIAGTGSATFDGVFTFDLTGASSTAGDLWTITDVATQTYGTNFAITGFTETVPGIWTDGTYRFSTFTGVLSVGAPAGTWDGDVSNLWSVAANWSSDVLPNFFGFANTITFADVGAVGATLFNDIVGAELGGIDFAAGTDAFVLSGNAVEMGGVIESMSSNGQEVAFDVSGTLEFDSTFGPITASGMLSGTNGLTQAGEADLILSNGSNDFSGQVLYGGLGSIVVAASGALGDPASEIQLNASFQGPLAALEFDGGVTQEKLYRFWARSVDSPAHVISTNGVNTMTGVIEGGSGGDRFILRANQGGTLVINPDWVQSTFSTGLDVIRCDGDGTITFNGDLDDSYTGSTLAILKANGDLGTLELVGEKTHNGNTSVASGTLALVDATSSNNVTSSGFLEITSTNGVFDFSGLMGGGIVLNSAQTLTGAGSVIGGVEAVSGSTIIPGYNGTGLLEMDGLTLNGGANMTVQLGDAGSDLIQIASGGSLVGPSSGVVTIGVELSGSISAGTYPILDWSAASTVIDVDLADFQASGGALSIVANQLVITFDLTSTADVLVTDTGNDRILKYNVTEFGVFVPDSVQPVFAEGVVGLFNMEAPGPLAKDSQGNVYLAETLTDLEDRVMKLDASGNHLATLAEVNSPDPNLDFSGTPAYIVVDPTDTYLYMSIAVPNTVAADDTLEDVIYRIDLSGSTPPVVYIDTTDVNTNYGLEDPQGLAFGPDGYLYVANNLNAAGSPDPGSRVLRFDVSGATGVFAGSLTTGQTSTDIRSLSYDTLFDRLIVGLGQWADIWAYNDLSLNDVAEGDPSFEYIYVGAVDEDQPCAMRIGDKVYFTNTTSDVIQRVDGTNTAALALDASAGLVDPTSLLVMWDDPFDFDEDGDVDVDDYAVFETLLVGPGVTTVPGGADPADFARADIDDDGDVDLEDWKAFTEHFSTD